jgi:hypothetical protein
MINPNTINILVIHDEKGWFFENPKRPNIEAGLQASRIYPRGAFLSICGASGNPEDKCAKTPRVVG